MDKRLGVYYLPGMGGSLSQGLGQVLVATGCSVNGRELQGDFAKLTFAQKVEAVVKDLRSHQNDGASRVIANSFGAYLFLHARF